MDRAYEGNETRQLALEYGMVPVGSPKLSRVNPWRYERAVRRRYIDAQQARRLRIGDPMRKRFSRIQLVDRSQL